MFVKTAGVALALVSSAFAAPAPRPNPDYYSGNSGNSGSNAHAAANNNYNGANPTTARYAAAPTKAVPLTTTTIYTTTGSAPLATSTSTAGGTVTVMVTVPTSCGNGGMDYAIFSNPFQCSSSNATYPSLDLSHWWQAQPIATGVVNGLMYQNNANSNSGQSTLSIYNTTASVAASQFFIMHHAYLYAREAGTYTFTSWNADDYTGLFLNTFAIKDYTRARSTMEHLYKLDQSHSKSFTVNLKQGQYVPFRVVYANGGGAAFFSFAITTPSGRVIGQCWDDTTPYVVRSSCDGRGIFPPYVGWGNEMY